MRFITLGSSSSGNGYLLQSSTGDVLIIEAGVKLLEIKKTLDFDLSMISGCIISHSHNDHSGKLKEYLNSGIRCFMNAKTAEEKMNDLSTGNIQFIFEKQTYKIGTFQVMGFDVVHDVRCFGYLIYHPECGFTSFITDTHYCPFVFKDLNNIIIEANYSDEIVDKKILSGDANMFVRNRVLTSHMEFSTAKEFIKANDLSKVNNIILIHLSDGNSNAPLFKREVEELTGKSVYIAEKGLNIEFNKTGI